MKRKNNIKTFAIGDIHGNLDLLVNLVEKSIKFDPKKHRLIFLGDYIDRGANSKGVVDYLLALRKRYPKNITLLLGNHEQMALDYFLSGDEKHDRALWEMNGGDIAIKSFGGVAKAKAELVPFIKSLKPYFETASHIFVHAGLSLSTNVRKAEKDEFLWTRAFRLYKGKKTLVVGHTPTDDVTILPNNVVMVDTGAFFRGVLSAFEVETEKVYKAVRVVRTGSGSPKAEPIAKFEAKAETDEYMVRQKLRDSLMRQLEDASAEDIDALLDAEFKAIVNG